MLLAGALGLAGCERDQTPERPGDADIPFDTTPAASDEATIADPPDTVGWTSGTLSQKGDSISVLMEVRAARHDEFERIVFQFGPGSTPGYKVEYVDRPIRQCGSGEVVAMPGDAWLMVRLEPANAHTEAGAPTVAERKQVLNYENIKELNSICDFEAVVEWVVAVARPNAFRVLELKAPARLVVDIKK